MITRLKIQNFRSHKNTATDLEPLTVFVGPVASGKSNIFKALDLLRTTVSMGTKEYFGPGRFGFRYERTRGARAEETIGIEVDVTCLPGFPGEAARYRIEIGEDSKGVFVSQERLERIHANGRQQVLFDCRGPKASHLDGSFQISEPRKYSVLHDSHPFHIMAKTTSHESVLFAMALAMRLYRIEYYHFEESSLGQPSSRNPVDRLDHRGGFLPSFLLGIREESETRNRYKCIEEGLKEVLGNRFRGIRLVPTSTDKLGLSFDFEGAEEPFLSSEMSDGTLKALALLCLAHQPPRIIRRPEGGGGDLVLPTGVMCIEEPENQMHPRLMQWVMDKLVPLAYPDDGTDPVQVLASTHSLSLVDFFKDIPSAVKVVESRDGRSEVKSISEEDVDSDVSLGDLWYSGLLGGV